MKTIVYRGVEHEVEDWVNFVAADYYGTIWGFEESPITYITDWIPKNNLSRNMIITDLKAPITNLWKHSLVKV